MSDLCEPMHDVYSEQAQELLEGGLGRDGAMDLQDRGATSTLPQDGDGGNIEVGKTRRTRNNCETGDQQGMRGMQLADPSLHVRGLRPHHLHSLPKSSGQLLYCLLYTSPSPRD